MTCSPSGCSGGCSTGTCRVVASLAASETEILSPVVTNLQQPLDEFWYPTFLF